MNASIVLAVLALVALAAAQPMPQQVQTLKPGEPVPVLQRSEIRDSHNQYSLAVLSGDGTAYADHGALQQNKDGEYQGDYVLARKGSYRYTSPEGTPVEIHWTADENGFRAEGDVIPKATEVVA